MVRKDSWRDFFRRPPRAYAMGQCLLSAGCEAGNESAWSLEDIRRLHRQGYGAVMLSAHQSDYLRSAKWWDWLREGVEEAKKLGLKVWIWDEKGYPSGAAGGLILAEHPDWQARGLLCAARTLSTTARALGEGLAIPSEVVSDDVVYACAVPADAPDPSRIVPLRLQKQRLLIGELPNGVWRVYVFADHLMHEGTFAVGNAAGEHLYVNLLEPEIGKRFVELTHEAYRANLGDSFSAVEAFFTDEPMLMTAPFPVKSDYPQVAAVPWVADMPEAFQKRAGYDLYPCLPALFANLGPRTAAIRCDFYRCVAELMAQRYFRPIHAWCQSHRVLSSGHLLGEESLVTHTSFEGDTFHALRWLDVPGIDLLSMTLETFRRRDQTLPAPKVGSSVAHCYGRKKIVTEASAAYQIRSNIPVSAVQQRASINWQYVLGVNCYFALLSYPELSDKEAVALNEYVGRLSYMLSGGRHVADIALLYPITSVWGNYVPTTEYIMLPPIGGADRTKIWSEEYAAEASRWDVQLQNLVWELLEHQRDFDIVDDGTVAASVVLESRLQVQDEDYRALILPPMDVIDRNSLEKAQRFAQAGGLVLGFYPLPDKSAQRGLDDELRDAAEALFGEVVPLLGEYVVRQKGEGRSVLVADMEGLLKALEHLLPADITIEPQTRAVFGLHRRRDGQDIFFLTNNGPEPLDLIATLRAAGQAEIWDPLTGTISEAADTERVGSMTRIPLVLDAYSGTLVVLTQDR